MAAAEPRIAIVGGSAAFVAEALAWTLTKRGIRVTGVYSRVSELPDHERAFELNVKGVIFDVDDGTAGPVAVAELRRARPDLKIVLLCERATRPIVRCAMDQQADGVILKSDAAADVVVALRHVLAGRAVMPRGWHEASREQEPPSAPLGGLSLRELEVLDLAAAGMSNRQIAEQLVISPNTVKFHLRAAYSRLGVRNRVQASQAIAGMQRSRPRHELADELRAR